MEGDTTTRKVVVRDMAAHPDPVDQTAETQTVCFFSLTRLVVIKSGNAEIAAAIYTVAHQTPNKPHTRH